MIRKILTKVILKYTGNQEWRCHCGFRIETEPTIQRVQHAHCGVVYEMQPMKPPVKC